MVLVGPGETFLYWDKNMEGMSRKDVDVNAYMCEYANAPDRWEWRDPGMSSSV